MRAISFAVPPGRWELVEDADHGLPLLDGGVGIGLGSCEPAVS